jgi:SAM-dependent methyltransferase
VSAADDLADSYDRLAGEYVTRRFNELDDKPFDRDLLDRLARRVRLTGPVLDLGCGPGHVTRYLHDGGVEIAGVDVSAGMIRKARQLNPEIPFIHGDMRGLQVPEHSLVGLLSLHAIAHVPAAELAALFTGWRRLLQPGAPLLLAFAVGSGTEHRDAWWGQPVKLDFHLFTTEQVKQALGEAGFQVTAAAQREPYPDEEPGARGYVLAEA